MGGLQLKDSGSRIKLFDWGRGPVPIVWAMLIVGLLILSNSAGLILSQPYIVESVPKKYQSYLNGTIDLPFLPQEKDDVQYHGPEEVLATDPFDVSFGFPDNRLPYLQYMVLITSENKVIFSDILFQVRNETDSLSLWTRISGIKDIGFLQLFIEPIFNMSYRALSGVLSNDHPYRIGPWDLLVSDNPNPHPIPIFLEALVYGVFLPDQTSNNMSFDVDGIEGLIIEDYIIETRSENSTTFSESSNGRWDLENDLIFGDEWTIFDVVKINGSGSGMRWSYLACSPSYLIPVDSEIRGSIHRAFQGSDELYGQEEEKEIDIDHDDDLKLFTDEFYSYKINIVDGNSPEDHIFFEYYGMKIFPDVQVDIDEGFYPATITSDGSYIGYLKTPDSQEEDLRLKIHIKIGHSYSSEKRYDRKIVLKEDHAPVVTISPNIFRKDVDGEIYSEPVEISLTAEWVNFNREEFTSKPKLIINGEDIFPEDEREDFFEHNFTYKLEPEVAFSSSNLEISSENSLEYANWLVLLIPTPNLFFVFPFPLTGWIAIAWFIMISIACIASVMLLFYRQIKPMWAGSKWTPFAKRMKKLYSPDSELALTAKTYLGALFFFFAIYWMLDIFEQPTPGLSILSSETPIWIRMFLLADASVWEEISGRVVLIGIPLFIIRSISGKRGVQWKQLVGGTAHFGRTEVVLILISATLFGLAHLGWGPWKVIPTFVHGLMFGYLYVKVGLHASIVMHFLFDYTGFINEITGIYGPTWILVFFTTILLGGMFLGDWVYRCQNWSATKILKRAPKPFFQLFTHSLLSVALGIILILKGGPLSISSLFFSVPLVDAGFYVLWKTNRSRIWRIIILVWSHFAWAAAPFGIAWAVRPEEDGVDQRS